MTHLFKLFWHVTSPSGWRKTIVHPEHIVRIEIVKDPVPEISRYTRVGPTVPSVPALSRELADVTAECFGLRQDGTLAFDIVGQANHGVCAVAIDPWAAYEHVERLDHIGEIVLKSAVFTPVATKARKPTK